MKNGYIDTNDKPVFQWYLNQGITPVPINPKAKVTIEGKEYDAISSTTQLEDPTNTSLSIVTPPVVTKTILEEARKAGVKAVWLQPGSFDEQILKQAKQAFPNAAVGGEGGAGSEGWCVLVDGRECMRDAEKLRKADHETSTTRSGHL